MARRGLALLVALLAILILTGPIKHKLRIGPDTTITSDLWDVAVWDADVWGGRAKSVQTVASGVLSLNTVTLVTAAVTVTIPDQCDSATGNWVTVVVQDGSETVSIDVDSGDTIKYVGLSMSAGDKLSSGGNELDTVTLVCFSTNTWSATHVTGAAWTDGD